MRTTTRLPLVISIAVAVGVAAMPVAQAAERPGSVNIKGFASHKKADKKQNKKIKKADNKAERAHERIADLKEWNFILQDWNKSQQETIDTIVAAVPTVTSALTALQGGLVALQAALQGPVATAFADIEDALNDGTTGLVGLNLARPQFGAFGSRR